VLVIASWFLWQLVWQRTKICSFSPTEWCTSFSDCEALIHSLRYSLPFHFNFFSFMFSLMFSSSFFLLICRVQGPYMHHLPQLSFLDCLNIARWYVFSPSHGTLRWLCCKGIWYW
jgi:hypothetical protein